MIDADIDKDGAIRGLQGGIGSSLPFCCQKKKKPPILFYFFWESERQEQKKGVNY